MRWSLARTSFLAAGLAACLSCSSVEVAVVSSNDIASSGQARAVIQTSAVGVTLMFHMVDVVPCDLDTVVNKLLVAEAKAMGASKVELKAASTTPRHGVFALTGGLIGFPISSATGVAVK